jgi:hypothetical protein
VVTVDTCGLQCVPKIEEQVLIVMDASPVFGVELTERSITLDCADRFEDPQLLMGAFERTEVFGFGGNFVFKEKRD